MILKSVEMTGNCAVEYVTLCYIVIIEKNSPKREESVENARDQTERL